jgi:hypothetical protein
MAVEGHHVTADSGFVRNAGSIVNPSGTGSTTTESAVATLEADGASPTQAHVTSLRAAWNTTKAQAAALGTGGVSVFFDTATIKTKGQLKQALDAFMFRIQGSNILKD